MSDAFNSDYGSSGDSQWQDDYGFDSSPPPPDLNAPYLPGIDGPFDQKGPGDGSPLQGCGCGLILAVLFAIVGGGLFALGGLTFRTYLASDSWEQASGRILSSDVDVSTDSEGDNTFRAIITYRYWVDDVAYEGDRVYFGYGGNWTESSSDASESYDLVEKYPAGKEVQVYYDPDDPEMVVLERKASWVVYLLMGIGGCIGGLAILLIPLLIISGLRKLSSTKSPLPPVPS